MKKFMRIALVFALAGATLMYTGCTKDYSGDISDLNKKVSENASAVAALQTQVAAAQTSANDALASAQNALKEAQAAAKAAADANNDAEVAALTERVAAIEDQIAELEAKVEALDGLEAKLNEVAEQLKKDVDAKVDAALEEIRAEVAALIESVGVTDFEIVRPYGLGIVYGQFNGVFSGLKAVEWDGPRAEEVAALEKGSYISSSNVNFLEIQVNPVNADLSDVDFDLEDKDGNVAPVDFYPATAYEDLKAASGVWYLPFTVGEITEEFVKRESGDTPIWNNAEASLVYNDAIRSNYISVAINKASKNGFAEFAYAWKDTDDEPEAVNTFCQKDATGTFTLVANNPAVVFDAYITKCLSTYEKAKFNVTFDGLTVNYDIAAVNKYLKDNESITFVFQTKQLNVNGYVKEQTGTTTLSIIITQNEPDEPEATKHEAVISTTATHEATPLLKNAAGAPAQAITIDLAEAAKAWGIEAGSAARAIWEEEFFKEGALTPEVVDAIFYPSADNSIEGDASDLFDSVEFGKKDGKWNGKATIYFSNNYPYIKYLPSDATSATDFEYVDPIGEVVELTFKLEDAAHKDAYIVTVPVQVKAPTAESIASWYKVSEITKYYENAERAKDATIDLSDAFTATKAFAAPDDDSEDLVSLAFGTKFSPNYTEKWAATQVKGTDALAADKPYEDLGAYVGDLGNDNANAEFKPNNGQTPAHFKVTNADAWAAGTKFTFVGSKSASFEVENLFVEAINGRLYPMSNVIVNIKCINEGQSSELSFAPAIELARQAGADNFWTATNSAFKPHAGTAYLGREFTLTGPNGNVVKINKEFTTTKYIKDTKCTPTGQGRVQYVYRSTTITDLAQGEENKYFVEPADAGLYGYNSTFDRYSEYNSFFHDARYDIWTIKNDETTDDEPIKSIETATTKESNAWVFEESLVDASVVEYDTNAGSNQTINLVKAYGLNFALKKNYTGDSNVIRVRLTFKAGSLVYVATGKTINEEVVVEFDINMK